MTSLFDDVQSGEAPGQGWSFGWARATNEDGSVIVGYGFGAFIWDEQNGMRDLQYALENEFGLDLSGWNLTRATGVSADGTVIVGYGDKSGTVEAWMAVIPELEPRAAEWVAMDGAWNACDTQTSGCYGAVPYEYQIGKYEVTNAQYAAFLNAVGTTDTNALYNTNMGSGFGGITRSGSPGSFTYSIIAGRGSKPVIFVSFWDTLRFANWLHNGQPTGNQNSTTTEDGAYTITPSGILSNSIVRNAGATAYIPTEDEWYKAAYYDPTQGIYYDYPAGSDSTTYCSTAWAENPNSANCGGMDPYFGGGTLTNVGSYVGAPSPNGTFDQGGSVLEWNETIMSLSSRGLRGGHYDTDATNLAASFRDYGSPADEFADTGFRVVSPVPEPGLTASLIVGAVLIEFGRRRRAT